MDTGHVLLIDDDDAFRQGLRSTLELAGYAVLDHDRALPALRHLDADAGRDVDLVLTDLRLPDLDGLQVLARCRAADADRPVVVMTAHDAAGVELARQRVPANFRFSAARAAAWVDGDFAKPS